MFIKYTNLFFNYTSSTCAATRCLCYNLYLPLLLLCFSLYCLTPSHKCLHALNEIETTSFCLVILLSKSIHTNTNRIFVTHTSILKIIPFSLALSRAFYTLQIFFSFRCTKFIISNLLPENKCDS